MDFPTTHWTFVLALRSGDATRRHDALASICETYWFPIYSFARRRGYPHDDAADLTQGFFLDLIERDALDRADPQRGRLRSFLLVSFKNFLNNARDRETARKRGGDWIAAQIRSLETSERYERERTDADDPERLFERQWALTVIRRVLEQLRVREAEQGRGAEFDGLACFLTGESERADYRSVALQLDKTEGAVRVSVHRLRKRFAALLRAEVATTVASPDEVDHELRALLAAFG